FLRGELGAAVVELSRALPAARTDDEAAEVRFFLALARLSQGDTARGLGDLRTVEFAHAGTRWARLAGVMSAEMARGRVLREAVMAAGADVQAARTHAEELEARV